MDETWRRKEIAKIMAMEVMVTEEVENKDLEMEVDLKDESVKTHSKKATQVIEKLDRQLDTLEGIDWLQLYEKQGLMMHWFSVQKSISATPARTSGTRRWRSLHHCHRPASSMSCSRWTCSTSSGMARRYESWPSLTSSQPMR